ncbi:unnamed protein product [Agarophyton chilense]
MFKRFSPESASGQSAMKSSQQRAARANIIRQMPSIQPYSEHFFPKKEKTILVKCAGHLSVLCNANGNPMFFQTRNGEYFPTLRTLHKYPFLLPSLRVDRGAIKHVINGADVMVPGLRSERAVIESEVEAGTAVAVFADTKQHPIAVGIARMSSAQMRATDKGIAVENVHFVSDCLWKCAQL